MHNVLTVVPSPEKRFDEAFLNEIALVQAISPIATHFSLVGSVVCHIYAHCLSRPTGLVAGTFAGSSESLSYGVPGT